MAGSATFTIETSSSAMKPTIRQTVRAFQRRGSGTYFPDAPARAAADPGSVPIPRLLAAPPLWPDAAVP